MAGPISGGPISGEPNLQIEALSCRPAGQPGQWIASWRIQNLERQPAEILSVWLPHDKFTSERRNFDPPLHLPGMDTLALELLVACQEPPGSVVENAFAILQLLRMGRSWRVFARHLITVDGAGAPQHICQSVTVQPMGISAGSGPQPSKSS